MRYFRGEQMDDNGSLLLRGVTQLTYPTYGVVCHPELLLGEAVCRALVDAGALDGARSLQSVNGAVFALKAPLHVVVVSDALGDDELDELLEALRHRQLNLPVLTLHEHADAARVADDLERGAAGQLSLDTPAAELCAGVRLALRGGLVIPAGMQQETLRQLAARAESRLDARRKLGSMTAREREVLLMLVAGTGRTEIARQLGISIHTVRTHLERVKAKLGARSQLEAAAEGRRLLGVEQGRRPSPATLPAASSH